MGFQLTIAKGLQAGKELVFEQPEVNIGRTSENDVLLKDSGVSRRHVRISERLGHYFAQDLGSSNGTLVNDKPLSGEQELHTGDRISLGPVELVFKEVVSEDDATRPFMPVEVDDATRPIRRNLAANVTAPEELPSPEVMSARTTEFARIVPPAAPRASTRSELPALAPAARPPTRTELPASGPPVLVPASGPPVLVPVSDAPAQGSGAPPRSATMGAMRAVVPETQAPSRTASRVALVATPAPGAAPLAPEVPTRTVSRAGMKVASSPDEAPVRASGSSEGLSAADKARRRRELGGTMGGQLTLWWSELSGGGRFLMFLVALAFVGGMLAAVDFAFRARVGRSGPSGPEPVTLTLQSLPDSFGLGEEVMWEQPDMKSFDFEFVSPTRAVGILRYQASDISKEEVSVSVNAANVGWVPPDTINAEREVQQILSPTVLKRNERNHVVFDNVRNPPGREGWRVWNLRLEIIPVPDLPPQELLETARGYAVRGRDYYQRKAVGAENLFHAWDNYRSAWITLEALEQKPDLYHDVRFMLGQIAVELDQKCGQVMLDFQRYIQFKDRKRARLVLQEMTRRFPTAAHRCHNLALDKANEYGL
ncbi:FHA domain-containing protein [Archangium sp.]|uniref:FHA domain-containing protein n=1 Tax=Archangium sp. TaxID=1872627 RepID=UPI002ED7AE70